jgi:hypothetical protein
VNFGRVLRGARFVLITAGVAIPATRLLYHYTPLRDAALGWSVFGIICVVAMANGLWEMFHPPQCGIDVTGNTVSFESASAGGRRSSRPPTA